MPEKVVPMIHVPDVRATVEWYESIGFTVLSAYGNDGEGLSFAMLRFGTGEIMFSESGRPSKQRRREVDLYMYVDNVDELYDRLKDRIEVVEVPADSFYGMREFIVRDLNGFWITFGQPSAFDVLMTGVREGNAEGVRAALEKGGLKPETITAALAAATAGDRQNGEIAEMLKRAGAVPPAEVDLETLQSYVGEYTNEHGAVFNVTLKDGTLFAAPGSNFALRLLAVNQTTFRPIAFDNFGTITFDVNAGKTVGCVVEHGEEKIHLKRVADSK